MHGLRAESGDLTGRVRALERRQVHHPDREIECRELGAALDRALRELAGAGLERDRVDSADPRQAEVERELDIEREQLGLRHLPSLDPRCTLACVRRGDPL